MNQLKIRRQILRNYAKTLVELEEKGIEPKELIYKKILEKASKVGLEIYLREEELRRAYFQCLECRKFISKEDDEVVKDKELIEELSMAIRPSKVCSVCEKEEQLRLFDELNE